MRMFELFDVLRTLALRKLEARLLEGLWQLTLLQVETFLD